MRFVDFSFVPYGAIANAFFAASCCMAGAYAFGRANQPRKHSGLAIIGNNFFKFFRRHDSSSIVVSKNIYEETTGGQV
jgi:hypothetical protein